MAKKVVTKLSDKDYQNLGKAIEQIIQKDYVDLALNKKRLIMTKLIAGLAAGFGGVIGATVVVALLLWLLSLFNEVPFFGKIFEGLHSTIQQ